MSWTETRFEGDPIAAVKTVMSSHATGKLILDISEGTVRVVTFREKVKQTENCVDTMRDNGAIIQAT
jgi:hypothetical protein